MSKTGKPTAAARIDRVNTVLKRLLDGETRADIFRFAAETWKLKPRSVDNLIAEARRQIDALAETDRRAAFAEAIGRLNRIYNTANRVKDYGLALRTQAELNRLLRLDQPPATARPVPDLTTGAGILAYLQQAAADATAIPDADERARAMAALTAPALRVLEITELEKRIAAIEAAVIGGQDHENSPHA